MTDVIPPPAVPRVPVRGGGTFPVRRIYCVGRNFADHAREMGATAPASKAERGTPVFFMKPAEAHRTALDHRGRALDSPGWAGWLEERLLEARAVALLLLG
jgi:hypothetical protein